MHGEVAVLLSWGEGLLFVGWMILMGFGHGYANAACRTNINFLLSHFLFTGIVLFVAMLIHQMRRYQYLHWGQCAAFLLAVAVDVNNLLEVTLHRPCVSDVWYGTVVMASLFVFMSCVVFLWYATLVWRHKYSVMVTFVPKETLLFGKKP